MSCTVFLGNLPTWVTADDIKSWLGAENLVADSIKVIRNPETQESKGFAFIEAPNGEEMQSAPTGDLLFGPEALVAYISTMVTLQPGDLILTGTPGGVGRARNPARYLRTGDVVETAIEGLGRLRNRIVADTDRGR